MLARAALVLAAGAALVAAATAGGSSQLVRHGVGIGKVRLGMTEAQVRAALGRPTWVVQTRAGFGGVRRELQFGEAAYSVGLRRRVGGFRAVAISTILSRERTSEGLGVGSPETRVRRAYGTRLRCEPLRTRQRQGSTTRALVSNRRSCALATPGRTETVFDSVVKPRRPGWSVQPDEWPRARVYIVTVRLAGAS